MSKQDRTEHLKLLAESKAYGFGYLNSLVTEFLEGRASEEFLREKHVQLQADLNAIREDGAQ